jgi:hypothetical protein
MKRMMISARAGDDAESSSSASEVEVDDDIDRSFLCVSTSTNPLCVSHAELDRISSLAFLTRRRRRRHGGRASRLLDFHVRESVDGWMMCRPVHRPTDRQRACECLHLNDVVNVNVDRFTYTRCSSCTRLDCVARCRRRRRRRHALHSFIHSFIPFIVSKHAAISAHDDVINNKISSKSPTVQLPKQDKNTKTQPKKSDVKIVRSVFLFVFFWLFFLVAFFV